MCPSSETVVAAAKERLREQRRRLCDDHRRGALGVQVCARLTDMLDDVVLTVNAAALQVLEDPGLEQHVALVAHGGYGRRDVAPYSDVDLMLLADSRAATRSQALAKRLVQDLFDAGLQVGFSLRGPEEARRLAMQDPVIFTSLAESRYLAGSIGLYRRFFAQLRKQTRSRSAAFINRIIEARRNERSQYGDTVHLLQPNVKRSAGGLRDLQLLRWIGFARHNEAEPDHLARLGAILESDRIRIRQCYDFLLRLRNELHFHAGKSQDVLNKGEQLRIAELWDYAGGPGVLPVEQMMREYFEHTSESLFRIQHFIDGLRRRSVVTSITSALFTRRLEDVYWIGPQTINATRQGLQRLSEDLSEVLRLMEFANFFNKHISHATWTAIRESMTDQDVRLTPGAARRFLSLMSQPFRLADLLRRLHQLHVLEKIIPAMQHARSLLQFNEYHKYTVDEHTFRAVQATTDFLREPSVVGEAYRQIADKRILHLAVLLHDLGKGYDEDHSLIGERIAEETAASLSLTPGETDDLKFLVRRHLYMAHTALRHDLFDEEVVLRFTREVGRIDLLRMLFVLTCADLAAVGPGVLNRWKLSLLNQLYARTRERLGGEAEGGGGQLPDRHEAILSLRPPDFSEELWRQRLRALPASFLYQRQAEEIAALLVRLRGMNNTPLAWGVADAEGRTVEYTIAVPLTADHGAFHRLTGVLSSKGMEILRADIHTLENRIVVRSFHVNDTDHAFPPPPERLEGVSNALIAALAADVQQPPTFRRIWKSSGNDSPAMKPQPTRVRIDTASSAKYTIITVFAYDRTGLLYDIAKTIFDLGLTIHFAKIATYTDQIVDVFYVTDQHGQPLPINDNLQVIRDRLVGCC